MLQEYWVDGMPVCYAPTGWYGVAKGKTDDGKFIFEANYGVTYYVKNTDVFGINIPLKNNSLCEALDSMKGSFCPYKRIINDYYDSLISFDKAHEKINNMKIPEGIKPEAPVVEYFNKYKEPFLAFVNAYSEKYKNTLSLIKNVCGGNLNKAEQSEWNSPYVRRHGKKVLKDAGIPEDIVEVLSTKNLGYVCESDITFGKIKLFDDDATAYAFKTEEAKNGFTTSKWLVNGFILCCSYVVITRPYDFSF